MCIRSINNRGGALLRASKLHPIFQVNTRSVYLDTRLSHHDTGSSVSWNVALAPMFDFLNHAPGMKVLLFLLFFRLLLYQKRILTLFANFVDGEHFQPRNTQPRGADACLVPARAPGFHKLRPSRQRFPSARVWFRDPTEPL